MDYLESLYETRMIVGFLCEKKQSAWWDSSFLSTASKSFLLPTFPKSVVLAQYNGVCQSAQIVHDEHIGKGRHFHLYRLPDYIEHRLVSSIQNDGYSEEVFQYLKTQEAAISRLKELGIDNIDNIDNVEGPVHLLDYNDGILHHQLNVLRSHYLKAIEDGYKTFPYMSSV